MPDREKIEKTEKIIETNIIDPGLFLSLTMSGKNCVPKWRLPEFWAWQN